MTPMLFLLLCSILKTFTCTIFFKTWEWVIKKWTVKESLTVQKEDKTQIEMQFECDSVLLNQSQLIELFDFNKANVNEFIKRISLSNDLFPI